MKTAIAILVILFVALPLRAATVLAEPFPPAKMTSLYIERDDKGTSMVVQSAGDDVIYKVSQGNTVLENVTVHPSGEDWFNFIQALNNAAKVYKWSPKYEYPGQGPSWVIDFGMENRKFYSEGTNEFPMNGDEAQPAGDPKAGPSIPFQLYWAAVLALVGKEQPGAPSK